MKRLFYLWAAALCLLAACNGIGGNPDIPQELTELKITATINSWGTGTTLEKNDEAGLYASAPLNFSNMRLTAEDASSLIAERKIEWKADSTVSTVKLVAYAPYSSSYSSRYESFEARADQTGASAVKASDLITATADVRILSKTASLSFSHKMVRIGIFFDNRTGKEISGVSFDNVVLGTGLDLNTGDVQKDSLAFAPTKVKLAPCTSDGGGEYFAAIVAPQTVRISGTVSFGDGSSEPLLLAQSKEFVSGQQWDNKGNPIVLSSDGPVSDPAEFDLNVSDWADDGTLPFIR